MVALAIIVAAIIVAGSITHGMKLIEVQLAHIKQNLSDIAKSLTDIEMRKSESNVWYKDIADSLNSLKKILSRNFRIAFNDEEFENL